jgi:hypothetical protein
MNFEMNARIIAEKYKMTVNETIWRCAIDIILPELNFGHVPLRSQPLRSTGCVDMEGIRFDRGAAVMLIKCLR